MKLKKILLASLLASSGLFGAENLPSGINVKVRTTTAISSAEVKTGDHWSGTLDSDIRDSEGNVIARRGDPVDGIIAQARSSGRLSDPGYLSLGIVAIGSQNVTSDNYVMEGDSHKKRNAAAVGGTAAAGALIGAIAGGGKGAAIGAGAGAGAGTAGAAATGKKDVTIPSETVLRFRLN